jgi:two-component system, OmpR family, sensor histidine kinase QseC
MKVWSRNYSLRQRVLAGLFVATFAYWSIVAGLTVESNVEEVHELYDIHLAHTALALLRLNDTETGLTTAIKGAQATAIIEQIYRKWPDLPQAATSGTPVFSDSIKTIRSVTVATDDDVIEKNVAHGKTLRYQMWRGNGELMFQSPNAPDTPMTRLLGFSISKDEQGKEWHNYSIWHATHEMLAIVSEADEHRVELVRSISISSMNPILLGMPLFILLIWLSVRRGLGPLNDLGLAISKRDSNSLKLLEEVNCPPELKPIVLSLNHLMGQIQQSLESERRFNANAAHELKTPLAAIKAHLYVANQSKSESERAQALKQAQAATDRGIRLISQMLAMARMGPENALAEMKPVNLNDIAQDVCAELIPLAMRREQTLEIQTHPGSMVITGHADLLHQLIENLVDNAMRYSPAQSQILLELEPTVTGLRLMVNDDGPGIPEQQREQVFNRFVRLADQSVSGTGLGLTICRKIAAMHDGHISLFEGPNGKGLSVHVDFASTR